MTADEKQTYRRKRNGIGWAIAALWWGYWLIQPNDGWGVAYAGGIMLAFFTWPFAFLVSAYIARAMVERESIAQAEQEQAAHAARQRRDAEDQAARMRAISDETQQARASIDRNEFIKKLGTVRDYLAMLDTSDEPNNQLLIHQSIDKELRDLVGKHETEIMAGLIARDDAIRLSAASVIETLERHDALSADAQMLKLAMLRSS